MFNSNKVSACFYTVLSESQLPQAESSQDVKVYIPYESAELCIAQVNITCLTPPLQSKTVMITSQVFKHNEVLSDLLLFTLTWLPWCCCLQGIASEPWEKDIISCNAEYWLQIVQDIEVMKKKHLEMVQEMEENFQLTAQKTQVNWGARVCVCVCAVL